MKIDHSADFTVATLADLQSACTDVARASAPAETRIEVLRPTDGRRPNVLARVRFTWTTGEDAAATTVTRR